MEEPLLQKELMAKGCTQKSFITNFWKSAKDISALQCSMGSAVFSLPKPHSSANQ